MKYALSIRPICCLCFTLVALALALPVPAEAQDSASADRVLRLESIDITGNKHTEDSIILRHIGLEPGAPITAAALESGRERLLATDYFTAVDFFTRPGSERGSVVLVIDVAERSFPSFETGFGYHDLYGWFLTLGGLRFDNLWGSESQLRIGARLGWRLAGLDADWRQSLSRDGFYGLGARLYGYSTDQRFWAPANPDGAPGTPSQPADDDAVWTEFQQKIGRAGAEVSFDLGRRHTARFSMGLRAEAINPDSSFSAVASSRDFGYESLPTPLQESLGKVSQTGVFLRALRDTRNTPVYPSAGTFSRFSLVSNNEWMGGDQIFAKTELDLRQYFHIKDGWVFAGRLAGGVASSGTPYYDRYYIGGIYSVRGFANWSLSNPGGDDGFWLANADLRWPLAGGTPRMPRVIGLVFVDAGQGWRRDESFDYNNIDVGAGFGVRVRIPWLGVLGFATGIPLTEPPTGDPFWIHGALNFSF